MSIKNTTYAALMLGVAAGGLATAGFAGDYDGMTLNLMTRPGTVIAGRLAERGLEFEEMTGAKVNVIEVPFA